MTAKFGSGGAVQWEDRFAPPGQRVARAFAVAVDPSTGAIAVGGADEGSMNETKSLVILYDGAGHVSWSKRISSDQKLDENILDVAFTPSGDVVASGRRLSRKVFHIEGLVYELKGSNGRLGWSQLQDIRPEDAIGGLALDAAGNAYTTGYATDFNLADPTVWITSRFDAATGHAWDVVLDVATYYDWDKGLDIAVTPAGEIVVTGRTLNVVSPPTFSGDATTIKYTQN